MRKKNVVPSFPAIWRFIGNCLAVILDSKGKPGRFLVTKKSISGVFIIVFEFDYQLNFRQL